MEIFSADFSMWLAAAFITGLGAGVVAGLFGVGGGIVIVPALLVLFKIEALSPDHLMQMAVATSLATIVVTNSLATWKQQQRKSINWQAVAYYTPGILLGAWLGALTAVRLHGGVLQILFGIFEIIVGSKMITAKNRDGSEYGLPRLGGASSALIGVIIGSVSSLFGIGGGTLSVPALNIVAKIPIRIAVGSSSAIGIFLAFSGTIGFILAGAESSFLPAGSWGYVIPEAFLGIIMGTLLTTPIGVKLAHTLPPAYLKKGFGIFLLLVGINLIIF